MVSFVTARNDGARSRSDEQNGTVSLHIFVLFFYTPSTMGNGIVGCNQYTLQYSAYVSLAYVS